MSEVKFTRTSDGAVPSFTTPAPIQPSSFTPVPPPQAPQPAPTPPTDTLTVTLPDGRAVTLKKPDVACQFMVYRILGGINNNGNTLPGLIVTVKSLMYIQSIEGTPVTRPFDHVQAQALMNKLGDDGVEVIASAYLQHFLMQGTDLPLSAR